MPKVEKITLSLGETRNLGNFESFRVEVTVEVRVEDGDKVADVYDKLSKTVRARLEDELHAGETKLDEGDA